MPPARLGKNSSLEKMQRTRESKSKVDMRMTIGTASTTMSNRNQSKERKPVRILAGKRIQNPRSYSGRTGHNGRRNIDPCENSNDSGLGFDQHVDAASSADKHNCVEEPAYKRSRLEIKLENDEVNENFEFPDSVRCKENTSLIRTAPISTTTVFSISNNSTTTSNRPTPRCIPLTNRNIPTSPVTLTTQLIASSKLADIALSILCQPEQQHRARYQTEGSRGAVKDRTGNGFPVVQLSGYDKPATLQVFIGTDCGKVSPHMFYQACRVSGKNSTPCTETKIDGTIVIELQLDPSKDMTVTCDCVGILKERNVDVEHRFPEQHGPRTKKKSTRCRMIFRTTITHEDGLQETLQVCSQPIVCTQPPGIPEICKKSLNSCPATGGLELFVLGKNFLKDTTVFFQQIDESNNTIWEKAVIPDKEFLQQTHLVCVIPPYMRPNITEPVTVKLYVASSGKSSEAQDFVYTPIGGVLASVSMENRQPVQLLNKLVWPSNNNNQSEDTGMMPPPDTNLVPIMQRRLSSNLTQTPTEPHSPPLHILKQETLDESSQNSLIENNCFNYLSDNSLDVHNGDSNLSVMSENSVDIVRHSSVVSDIEQRNVNENSTATLITDSNKIGLRPFQLSEEATVPEDNSCHSLQIDGNSTNNSIVPPIKFIQNSIPASTNTTQNERLNVVDLRMRPLLGTVADLSATNAPSLATLETFGITEGTVTPLPAQSSQSVENYLNKIETKPLPNISEVDLKCKLVDQIISKQLMPAVATTEILNGTSQETNEQNVLPKLSPVYINPQKNILTNHICHSTGTNSKTDLESHKSQTICNPTLTEALETITAVPITTEKLDALVNCAVESHICNSNDNYQNNQANKSLTTPQQTMQIHTQDVLLNHHNPIIVPPIINCISPHLIQSPDVSNPTQTASLSTDVILNSQISPSLMCCANPSLAQENFLNPTTLNICNGASIQTAIRPHISSVTTDQLAGTLPLSNIPVTQPDKNVFLNGTGLIETHSRLDEMVLSNKNDHNVQLVLKEQLENSIPKPMKNNILPNGDLNHSSHAENTFISSNISSAVINYKHDVTQINITEEQKCEKKHEEIPSVFTTMTETELINIINPNCFDQV